MAEPKSLLVRCIAAFPILAVSLAATPGSGTAVPGTAAATFVLSGEVASADSDRPLEGARVLLVPDLADEDLRALRAAGGYWPEPIATTQTDAQGRFRLAISAGRRALVVAEAAGRARSRWPRVVTGGSDEDLGRLALPAGRRVTGRVLDAAGRPLAGALLAAIAGPRLETRRMSAAGFTPVALSGPDGTFTIDGVPQRVAEIRAVARGAASGSAPSRGPAPVEIRLQAGHPVAGRVVGSDGKTPIGGAWVLAGEDGWRAAVRSGADGAFRIDHLADGEHDLVATAAQVLHSEPGRPATAPATFAPSLPFTVTTVNAGNAILKLRPGGTIRVRAVSAADRTPVAGAEVALDAPGEARPRRAVVGPTGEVLFTGVPAASVTLTAVASGFLDEKSPAIALAAGSEKSWSAPLRAAASIAGTVRDASGRAIAAARITVSAPPDVPMRLPMQIFLPLERDPVLSDAQGQFRLQDLPPGRDLRLEVVSAAHIPWTGAPLRLLAGEKKTGLEVRLETGGGFTGRIVDRDGQPVAGASVSAARRAEGGGAMVIRLDMGGRGGPGGRRGPRGSSEEGLPPSLSGPDGLFRIGGVRPGVWNLEVTAPGFAPRAVDGVSVAEGEQRKDLGDLALDPGAVLAGVVLTPAGEPVPFADVSLRRDFANLGQTVAGADGRFALGDLAPGAPLTLVVDADGYAAVEQAGVTPPAADLAVTLGAAARVSGTALDRDSGKPLTDFSLTVSRSRSASGGGAAMSVVMQGPETTFQTADGTWVLDDVDPGSLTLTALAPGWRPSVLRDLEVAAGAELEGVVFSLDKGVTISGTAVDDEGRPLPGVSVDRKSAPEGGMMRRIAAGDTAQVVTDGDGAFALGGLEPGRLTLQFRHPEFETHEQDVDATRDVSALRVSLSKGATLTGTVRHAEGGQPLSGARLTLTPVGTDAMSGGATTSTHTDGSFALGGVATGRYTLRAEAPGLRTSTRDDIVISGGAAPPPLDLVLEGGVAVRGMLLGLPEQGRGDFTVTAIGSAGWASGISAPADAAGRFELRGLAPGTLTLMARSGFLGGRTGSRTVTIPEGVEVFEADIEFPAGRSVQGRVTRGDQAVVDATIIFMHSASRSSASARTDTDGRYAITGLEDGEHDVSVLQFASGVSYSLKTEVAADRALDIRVPLARLTGVVVDAATGDALSGATIGVQREGESSGPGMMIRREAVADASGYFALDGLGDGNFTLTARHAGYGFVTRSVLLGPGQSNEEIVFELSRVEGFTFRVLDGVSGLPLRSIAAIVLQGAADPLATGGAAIPPVHQGGLAADASGLFHLESLQPGTYRLVLGGQGLGTETLDGIQVPGPEAVVTVSPAGQLEISVPGLEVGETARAALYDTEGRPIHPSALRPDPSFMLRGGSPTTLASVKAGVWRLRVVLPDGGRVETTVTVEPGGVRSVTVP